MSMSEEETAAQRCHDCKKSAPATDTNYTLISKQHGWRLDRRRENGTIILEWRCPECWQRFKARNASARSAPPSSLVELPAKTPRKT
jgi:hypothetical protein